MINDTIMKLFMKNISHNKPYLDKQEARAVAKVLQSDWLTTGKEVEKLENNIKKLVGAKYAVAVNSGTSALHLSLLALGTGLDDEVIIPTYTCSALLNATYYTGATPVVVDVESDGFNIDGNQVKKKIGKKTKAVIVPHTHGFPAKIEAIKKFGLPVIEDCAIALGTTYLGKSVGNSGDLAIFSFYASKVITTGYGGMVVTKSKKYYQNVKNFIYDDQAENYQVSYNYQLNDIAASIGNIQFERLEKFLNKRKEIAAKYVKVLKKKKNIQCFPKEEDSNVNHYRFIIKFQNLKERDRVKEAFRRVGITTIVPIDTFQLLHRYLKLDKSQFPNAENLAQTTLSLPIFPALTQEEIARITQALDSTL